MINCKNCGKEIPGDFKFCPECGTKIPANNDKDDTYLEDQKENDLVKENESVREVQIEPNTTKESSDLQEPKDFLPRHSYFLKNRKVVLISTITVIILAGIAGGIFKYIFDSNYDKGIEAIDRGSYEQAITYLEKSFGEEADEALQLAIRLNKSENCFAEGMKLYNEKRYDNALTQFSQVDKSSDKYKKTQEIIITCKQSRADELFIQAKEYYDQKDYTAAYNSIQTALNYGSTSDEISELNSKIQEKMKEIADKEAAAAEVLAQQEEAEQAKAAELERQKYAPQKIVDSNGKQIWKIYISDGDMHFTGTYNGSGNFIVQLLDDNQDFVELIANEIGDYVSDKTVYVPYEGWYYLQIEGTDGKWSYNWY